MLPRQSFLASGIGLLATVCLTFCSGCARVNVVHHERGFNLASLGADGASIGAVTGLGGGEFVLADYISTALRENLQNEHPEVRLVPLDKMKSFLSGTEYDAFLRDFSEAPVIRPEHFDLLMPVRAQSRFVWLVNIDGDETEWEESRSEVVHERTVKDPKTGKEEKEHDYTEYVISRTISQATDITFIICDLETRRPVWIAVGSAGRGESRSSTSTSHFVSPPPWPNPPHDIIERIIKRAVRKLPEEKGFGKKVGG